MRIKALLMLVGMLVMVSFAFASTAHAIAITGTQCSLGGGAVSAGKCEGGIYDGFDVIPGT